MTNDLLRTASATLSNRHASMNIARVLDARLTISEAIGLVGKICRGFPNKDKVDKAYIGAIAELLMHYPKTVAEKCAHPIEGVVRGTKYLPTPSDIINW